MRKALAPLLFVVVALMVAQAGASLVTSISGGTTIPMPALNFFGGGPITFGPANLVTWSSTNCALCNQGGSVFGYTTPPNIPYGFGSNGSWDGALGPMAGVNSSNSIYGVSDTMTFAFASPVRSVGGFLDYVPDMATTPTTIAVYDSSCDPRISTCTPIESFDVTFLTGGGTDTGMFLGFTESSKNISYFTLTDNFLAITNLTVVVPEPGTLLLIGTGLLGAVGFGRRRLGL
jgi:PEP-CTERM motif